MDVSSWIATFGDSLKTNQTTLVVLIAISYAGYRWVSKIDAANREDHARLGEKVDSLKDTVAESFQEHLDKWHNPSKVVSIARTTKKRAAKKK